MEPNRHAAAWLGWDNRGHYASASPEAPGPIRQGCWWNDREDYDLLDAWTSGRYTVADLAARHQRVRNAIELRLSRSEAGALRYLEYLVTHPDEPLPNHALEDPMTRRPMYDEVSALLQRLSVEQPGRYFTAIAMSALLHVNGTTAGSVASRLVAEGLAEQKKVSEHGRRESWAYRWKVAQGEPTTPRNMQALLDEMEAEERAAELVSPQRALPFSPVQEVAQEVVAEPSGVGLHLPIRGRLEWFTVEDAKPLYQQLERNKHLFLLVT